MLTLEEALAAAGPITFFDDCNISATQSRTAVQVWLGMEPELPREANELANRLTRDQAEALLARRTCFRFAYAHRPGIARLADLLSSVGLGTHAVQTVEERDKPLTERPASPELVRFLHEVGRDVLGSTKGVTSPDEWPDDRVDEFALGYGDRQQLVVMFYNTPTDWVTAL